MMNAEQKQAARNLIDDFKDAGNEWDEAAVASHMAALLQELVDAPPAPSVPDGWRPFLTDVITAAGLLQHGKRDKGLAGRIGKFAFDAMPAAPTPAEAPADVARDAALYCAVQRSCAELPEGWEIRIELERSAGTVSLVNPDGEDVDYPSDHEYMASDINDAIDSAIAAEKGGAK